MQYAIIDESGRFGDKENPYMVFAAVCADSLIGLDKIIPKIKKKIPTKGFRKYEKNLSEIKFSTTGDKTRKLTLALINKQNVEIYLLVVETEKRKIVDNPENYALIASCLIQGILKRSKVLKHILIDRHFTWVFQREKFNDLVQRNLEKELFIEHLDSQQNTVVSLADFVAGAVREYYAKDNKIWKAIIRDKIAYEVKIPWRKFRQQKR